MVVYGFEAVSTIIEQDGYLFKIIANESGVVLFPHTTEHRDATYPGIKYVDDSFGNALAGMVKPGDIEFRFHKLFSDERVKQLAARMLILPEFMFARSFSISYQARPLLLKLD